MRNYKAKDVDEYIASSVKEARLTLEELRKVIKKAVPEAEERISWGVPFYRYHGLLAGYSVFKNHVTFGLAFVFSEDDRTEFEKQGYKTGKKTVQIRFDQKVPASLISRMIKTRAKLNKSEAR